MNTVKANGLLRHHFWGIYRATITLQFDDEGSAEDALRVLGEPWIVLEEFQDTLCFHGTKDELTEVENTLVKYGADANKISSLAKSIDFGEQFHVEIPIVPKEQLPLF